MHQVSHALVMLSVNEIQASDRDSSNFSLGPPIRTKKITGKTITTQNTFQFHNFTTYYSICHRTDSYPFYTMHLAATTSECSQIVL